MDPRYRRVSPNPRLSIPARSSGTSVDAYDDGYSRSPRDHADPRGDSYAYSGQPRALTTDAYSGRPRRNTATERAQPVIVTASPTSTRYDREDYDRVATSPRADYPSRHLSISQPTRRQGRDGSRDYDDRRRDRDYHSTGPSSQYEIDDSFSYTDAAGMYQDTEPSRARRRRGSLDEEERRPNVVDSYELPPRASGDLRTNRDRELLGPDYKSRGRAETYDDYLAAPVDRHRDRPVSASRIPLDESVYDYGRSDEPHRSRLPFKDGRVEVRGFGIVAPPSRDHSAGYSPPPPKEAPRAVSSIYASDPKLSQPNVRDFIPRSPEVERKDRDREWRDYDRDYARRDREDHPRDRDRDRDREYRDSDRLRHATNATVVAAGAGAVAYAAAVGVAEKKRERERERALRDKDADRTVDVEYDVRPDREREKRRTDRDRPDDHERLPPPDDRRADRGPRRKEPEVEVRRAPKPAQKDDDEYPTRDLPDRRRNSDESEDERRRRVQREEPRPMADSRALVPRAPSDDESDGNSTVDAKSTVSTDKDREDAKRRVKMIVEPPKKEEAPAQIKSILRKPTTKFPDHHDGIREGVTPLEPEKKGIPKDAKWTKIDRRLVNPEALDLAQLRYEERLDCVIVLKVLTKEEIQALADKTAEIRGTSRAFLGVFLTSTAEKEEKYERRTGHKHKGNGSDNDDSQESDDDPQGRRHRDRDRDHGKDRDREKSREDRRDDKRDDRRDDKRDERRDDKRDERRRDERDRKDGDGREDK
jgi:hypothetical protein